MGLLVRLAVLALVISPLSAQAARYWVDPSGSDATACASVSGDADPGVYRATPAGGIACLASGDRLTIKSGVYTGSTATINGVPSGTFGLPTIIEGDPGSQQSCAILHSCPTIIRRSGTSTTYPLDTNYVTIRKLDFDAVLAPTVGPIRVGGVSHDWVFEDVEAHNGTSSGINGILLEPRVSFVTVMRANVHHNGAGGVGHGGYFSGDDITVANSWFHDNSNTGFQCYNVHATSDGRPDRCHIYGTVIENNGFSGVIIEGNDSRVHHNIVRNNGASGVVTGYGGGALRTQIYNNVIYNNLGTYGVNIGNFGVGSDANVKNNIIIGHSTEVTVGASSTGVTVSHNACLAGDACGTTGKLTVTSVADIWTNPAGNDFTVTAGSPTINAGTDVGLAKCGSAPEIGPFEACGVVSASITGSTVDVTMENVFPPLQVVGASGWIVGCTPNPDACGTPSVLTANLLTDTAAIVRLSVTGIANTNCTTGQTWTVSFNAAVGTMLDSMQMMGTQNQAVHSFSAQAVINNCTGAGGGDPPAGAYIYYTMNGNANDSSGGNRHATTSGVSFAAAKYAQGMQTNPNQNDYAELPYLAGVNPTTQSLTIAYGVYVPPSDLGVFRYVGGVPLGTDQRMYVMRNASNNWRMGVRADPASMATEFAVHSGWTHVCQTMDASTDTATLWIDGVQGAAAGASVQTYTSYTFAGNYRIGLPDGRNSAQGGDHLYDEFRLYQSVVSCADLYTAWEPPTSSWTGTISTVSTRMHGAKTDWLGAVTPQAAVDTNIAIAPSGAFTYAGQIDCTVADCTAISYKLYYTCAACPSAGASLVVPDTATSDEIAMFGSMSESGLLTGAHGTNLSGALTHLNGTTLQTSTAAAGPDLAQNNSTVHRAIVRVTTAATIGRQYCFKWREQSGLALDSYTPSGGLCVTVGTPGAAAGF